MTVKDPTAGYAEHASPNVHGGNGNVGDESTGCGGKVKKAIVGHWTVTHAERTPEQSEAEKRLICIYLGKNRYFSVASIPFNRWYLFFAAFLVQFCIGSLYSWSIFNKPIDAHIYNDETIGRAVNAFYTAVGVFGTTTAIMGPWIERHGPRAGVMLGCTMFFIAHMIIAISIHFKSIAGVYIGYGVFGGFGMGLCYISPVSALQKWFPDYRGTAAGFAVGGYGAGSVVWGKVYLPLIDAVGLSSAFIVIGCIYALILYSCCIALRIPPPEFQVSGLNIHGERVGELEENVQRESQKLSEVSQHEFESLRTPSQQDVREAVEPTTQTTTHVRGLTLIQAITSIDFVVLYVTFFANQTFGLMVLSKLSGMCVDLFGKTQDQGSDAVAINGVFNSVGRLLFPMLSDAAIRFFKSEASPIRRVIFHFTLTAQVIVIATLPTIIQNEMYGLFLAWVFLLTLSYGGGFGSIPCFLTDMFGAYNIGAMHGIILTAWSIGGVAGGIAFSETYLAKLDNGATPTEAYSDQFHTILIVVIIGWVLLFFVRTNSNDRFVPGYRFSVCNKEIVHFGKHKAAKGSAADSRTRSDGLLANDA